MKPFADQFISQEPRKKLWPGEENVSVASLWHLKEEDKECEPRYNQGSGDNNQGEVGLAVSLFLRQLDLDALSFVNIKITIFSLVIGSKKSYFTLIRLPSLLLDSLLSYSSKSQSHSKM